MDLTKSGIRAVAGFEDEFRPSPSLPVREVIRVRRQWGLRLARRKESRSISADLRTYDVAGI
jgi:hypothetical protein